MLNENRFLDTFQGHSKWTMKCQRRKSFDFTQHNTELAISFALDNITPEFSHGVFRHCGYLL